MPTDDEHDDRDDPEVNAESDGGGGVRLSPNVAALARKHGLTVNGVGGLADSNLASRYNVAARAGQSYGGDRDLYTTLGYDRNPSAEDYLSAYTRNHIARRIVDAPVKATWSNRPSIVDEASDGNDDEAETEFERAVEYLFDEHRLLHYLERADKATGVGEYGLLFFGLASGDTVGLDDDATNANYSSVLDTKDAAGPDDLAYLATFTQGRVTDIDTVDDPTRVRYGMPEAYDLKFELDTTSNVETVHHSRVIHIVEDVLENETYGRPRLEAVYNRLVDLEKVVGGSAEMFYRGADRKLQLNYTGDGSPPDADDLAEQADEMVHGLRNVLQTSNVDVNTIGGEDVDPTGVVEQILKLIAGETGIPLRILTGSERGELASSQDRATFYKRISERQVQHAEPSILRPVLDRLIALGILPEPQGDGYVVEWPNLFELTDLEHAELMEKKAKAIKAASGGRPLQVAETAEVREQIFGWGPELGSESSLDDGTEADPVPDEDVSDEDAADREAFEDVLDDLDLGDVPDEPAGQAAATDGGAAQGRVEPQAAAWLTLTPNEARRLTEANIPATDDLDALYKAYNEQRNMSVSDLERWENSTCFEDYVDTSDGDPQAAVDRNKRLISRSKDEWTANDRRDAVRMLSFHKRHRAQDSGQAISDECDLSPHSAGRISWATDPTGRYSGT